MCIISILIGHFDLQGDVLLVAERDHWHTALPLDRQKVVSPRADECAYTVLSVCVCVCVCVSSYNFNGVNVSSSVVLWP